MDAKRILKYLRQLAKNNNRTWFQEHRQEYDAIRADFEQGVEQAIRRIITFDPSVSHLTVKDRARFIQSMLPDDVILSNGYVIHRPENWK